MAITYPLSAAAFWESLRFASRPEFVRLHKKKQSEDGGGNVRSASLGAPKWGTTVAIEGGRHDANMGQEADIGQMEMRDGTFLAYDIRRPWPASDDGGAKLAGGSVVGLGGEAAYGDVSLATYRYEGSAVTQTQAVSVVGDAGTYFDADGVLQTSAANALRVDYGPFANLLDLRYVKAFDNAYWTKSSGSITATANTTVAPDGTTTADTITVVASAGIGIYATAAVAPSTQYTFSMYVKLGTMAAADFKLAFRDDTAGVFIASDVAPTQVPTASGWTRISYTLTTPVGCALLRAYAFRNSAAVAGTVFLWGAVLNAGASALTYPRLPLGIAVEPAFTNLLLRSEEMDNASWTTFGTPTITANNVVAPDGATTADRFVGSASDSGILQTKTGLTAAAIYTGSIWMRADAPLSVNMYLNEGGSGNTLVSCSVTTIWTRFSVTRTMVGTSVSLQIGGAGTLTSKTIYLWGAQLEAGSASRSYLKTTTATVSRAADALTFKGKGGNVWSFIQSNGAAWNPPAEYSGNLTVNPAVATPGIRSWTATRITQPTASTVQIKSKGSNNRSIALKGLPPFFTVTKTDKLSVAYSSTKVFLCEAQETVTADYLGETAEFEIFPFLPAGIAVNDAVTLAKPCGKFKVVSGSYKPASGQGNISSGAGFSMVSVP